MHGDKNKTGSVTVPELPKPKVTLDVQDKQRIFIEFLMLERYTGEENVIRFQIVYGSAA
jgi:hypothetical protein